MASKDKRAFVVKLIQVLNINFLIYSKRFYYNLSAFRSVYTFVK